MTSPNTAAPSAERPAVRRRPVKTGTLAGAAAAFCVVAALSSGLVTGRTSAGFTDSAKAAVTTSGSYDIVLEGVGAASGQHEQSQGAPEPFVLAVAQDAVFSKNAPVTWDVTVVNAAAPGEVFLTVTDPQDEPFVVGATTYPDLFTTLRFTVTDADSGAVLAAGSAAQIATISLGRVGTDESRSVRFSVLVDAGTRSVYHQRTTAVAMTFSGTTA